jgi:hypothetical protein
MHMNAKPNPDVLWQRLDDEIVLLHLQNDRVFSLNTTGARLWEMLVAGMDLDSIRAQMAEEFEVSASELEAEIDRLLATMIDEQLIVA